MGRLIAAILLGMLVLGLEAQGLGFQLTAPLTFAGFSSGRPMFQMGNGLIIMPTDPSLLRLLREMEGKKVRLMIDGVEK